MSRAVRELKPGEVVIGFMTRYGKQIGDFADPAVGHDVLADRTPDLRSQLKSGQAIGITVGKNSVGEIFAFGSGVFPPPGGIERPQNVL